MPFTRGHCLTSMARCGQFHIRKAEAELAGLSQKGVKLSNVFLADAGLVESCFSWHMSLNEK